MGESARTGRRTGRPRTLDADQIVAAARAVGVADFTMPAVASRLGVSHSTLYRYFADREDLAVAAINQIIAEARWPAPGGDWRAAVTDYGAAMWTALDDNPGLARASWQSSTVPAAIVPVLEALGAHVVAHGFTPYDAVLLIDFVSDLALSTFVLMTHLDGPAKSTPDSPTIRESYQRDMGRIPLLGAAIPDGIWHGRGWFDEKLAIFLDGFALRRHATASGTSDPDPK